MTTKVIFDTDAGGDIDDLYALALILKHPQLSLLGVTTVSADTQARARLMAKMLRLAGREDVPVFAGIRIPKALVQRGVSEVTYKQYLTHLELVNDDDPESGKEYNDAIAFMLEQLSQTEEPITLIGTGPWTNVAEVIRRADARQRSMIGSLALMGGEVHLLHAESNVQHDPEAADLILQSGLPIFLATWSVSQKLAFSMAEVAALTHGSPSPFLQALREATDMWWEAGVEYKPGPMCYDAIPVFWAAGEREHISCIKLDKLPVELTGTHTRGMMFVHPWERMHSAEANVTSSDYLTVTHSMNAAALKKRYIDFVLSRSDERNIQMQPVGPIYTVDLFPELHSQLVQLLKGLSVDDWQKPTVCAPWSIKDVTAHLLDGYIRRLSLQRDNLPFIEPETPITSQQELIVFLDQLNADWVNAARRISPRLLIAILELTGPMIHQLFEELDPNGPAFFSVGWAGDESSPNWFDIAREYTEQWMHHMHICDALSLPGPIARHQMYPVLDAFMRALPVTYESFEAVDGESVTVIIEGEAGGEWSLLRQQGAWRLYWGKDDTAATQITLNQDTAWRLFTKGLSVDEARKRVQIKGNPRLGEGILHMVSIMA